MQQENSVYFEISTISLDIYTNVPGRGLGRGRWDARFQLITHDCRRCKKGRAEFVHLGAGGVQGGGALVGRGFVGGGLGHRGFQGGGFGFDLLG